MSKKRKQTDKQKYETESSFLEKVKLLHQHIIVFVFLIIPIIYLLSPYIFENKIPSGSDIVGSKGNTHYYIEYQKAKGETVLWNPSIFGGIPIYHRISPYSIHIDSAIKILSKVVYEFFWYFLLAGYGLFLFLKRKKIPWYLALIVCVALIILPDWQALIGHGHFSKIRAILVLPWLLFTFDYLVENRTWLATGLFALVFSWLVRTHHFQIVFYGIVLLVFLYTYPILRILLQRNYKEFGGFAIKLIIAIIVTIMTSAQPLLTTQEYADYSTRGGDPVNLGGEAKTAKASGGVSFEYATQWSLAPREIIDFFIPRFTGGTSAELYDGKEYPNIKGQQVPGYWGKMPFTDNYDTMGMLLFLFAIIGGIYYRKNPYIIFLSVFIVFSVLLALGRHFPSFYNIFYSYLPYFSKFRVPVMFAHITFIATFILAAFGLKAAFEDIQKKDYRLIFGVFGSAILFLLVIILVKDSFSYITAKETTQYNAQTINIIKGIRKEFLMTDSIRLLILILLTTATITGFLLKKIKKDFAVVLILIFVVFEVMSITNRQISKIQTIDPKVMENTAFKSTEITNYLSKQPKTNRALIISKAFQSNYYAYYYPTINGYSAIKLQLIQDIIDHNLFGVNTADRLNWPIINMMNGKYVVTSKPLNESFLEIANSSEQRKETLYKNNNVLPKAWFVKEVKLAESKEAIVLAMNESNFKPDSVAHVLESPSKLNLSANGTISLEEYTPSKIVFDITTDEEQFLVLSEVYYPEGWKAKINDEEIKIYQTNHILRGVQIPGGNYKLSFEFSPQTYYSSLTYLWIGNIIILGLILVPLLLNIKKKNSL